MKIHNNAQLTYLFENEQSTNLMEGEKLRVVTVVVAFLSSFGLKVKDSCVYIGFNCF